MSRFEITLICNKTGLEQQENISHVSYDIESMSETNLVTVCAHHRRKNFLRNFDERNSMQELTLECLEIANLEDDVKC